MAFGSIIKNARHYADEALVGLGSVGARGTHARGLMNKADSRVGLMKNATSEGRNTRLYLGSRDRLIGMGKRRALIGGAGIGVIGMSSGASGMRAKSSGGYTG